MRERVVGLQGDWSRLTVRELVQQFHEPRARRLRLYLAAVCRTKIWLFDPRSPSFTMLIQALDVAERYADGLAEDDERQGALDQIIAYERSMLPTLGNEDELGLDLTT